MLEVHSRFQDAFPPLTREQDAARSIGCAEGEDSEKASVLPWVLGCIGFWIIVGCAVLG